MDRRGAAAASVSVVRPWQCQARLTGCVVVVVSSLGHGPCVGGQPVARGADQKTLRRVEHEAVFMVTDWGPHREVVLLDAGRRAVARVPSLAAQSTGAGTALLPTGARTALLYTGAGGALTAIHGDRVLSFSPLTGRTIPVARLGSGQLAGAVAYLPLEHDATAVLDGSMRLWIKRRHRASRCLAHRVRFVSMSSGRFVAWLTEGAECIVWSVKLGRVVARHRLSEDARWLRIECGEAEAVVWNGESAWLIGGGDTGATPLRLRPGEVVDSARSWTRGVWFLGTMAKERGALVLVRDPRKVPEPVCYISGPVGPFVVLPRSRVGWASFPPAPDQLPYIAWPDPVR